MGLPAPVGNLASVTWQWEISADTDASLSTSVSLLAFPVLSVSHVETAAPTLHRYTLIGAAVISKAFGPGTV